MGRIQSGKSVARYIHLRQTFIHLLDKLRRHSVAEFSLQSFMDKSMADLFLNRLYAKLQGLQDVIKVEFSLQNSLEHGITSLIQDQTLAAENELFLGQKQLRSLIISTTIQSLLTIEVLLG